MALRGNYSGELDAINCGVINADVLTRDDADNQIMSRVGLATEFKHELAANIPDHCPLTKPRDLREVGSFAVCVECPHSILVDDTGVEC